MAVTLNANTSTGFIATSDTSGVLQLQTGGTAAVTVDASQNVGIGTSSPSQRVDSTVSSTTEGSGLAVTNSRVDGYGSGISFYSTAMCTGPDRQHDYPTCQPTEHRSALGIIDKGKPLAQTAAITRRVFHAKNRTVN